METGRKGIYQSRRHGMLPISCKLNCLEDGDKTGGTWKLGRIYFLWMWLVIGELEMLVEGRDRTEIIF